MDGGAFGPYDGNQLQLAQEEHVGGGGGGGGWWFLRRRTLRAAVFFIVWGAASILHGAVPDLSANPDHILLCFSFLVVGVALLFLAVADLPAAARLEGWLMAIMP